MKKILLAIICIALLGTAIFGVVKVKKYREAKEKENTFLEEMHDYAKENQVEVTQEYFYNDDDIVGWYFYKKDGKEFINIYHYAMIKGNKEELVWKRMPIYMENSVFQDGDVQEQVTKSGTNSAKVEYTYNGNELACITINYEREGSCGEYTNRLFVKDIINNKVVSSSGTY